jgi:hypothetical protein
MVQWRAVVNTVMNFQVPYRARISWLYAWLFAGHVARRGEGETCTGFWWESPKEKRSLQRRRRRWEDGIKMGPTEIGWGGGVEWIHLAQDRDRWRAVVNAVMYLRVLAPRSQLCSFAGRT